MSESATPSKGGTTVVVSPSELPAQSVPQPATARPPRPATVTTGGAVRPHHYREGKLTREGMVHVINSGGSVVHEGKIYNSLATLPTEADLAKDDIDAQKTARANINRRRAELDAEEATLNTSLQPKPKVEPKTDPVAPPAKTELKQEPNKDHSAEEPEPIVVETDDHTGGGKK